MICIKWAEWKWMAGEQSCISGAAIGDGFMHIVHAVREGIMARTGGMKRCLLAALAASLLLSGRLTQAAPVDVAVDVGHTLAAPGATSARGRSEFEFNRELARAVVRTLQQRRLEVATINADGLVPSLQARPRAAGGARFFLSIHHDSVNAGELQPWIWDGRRLDYSDAFAGHSLFASRANPDTARSILCARTIGARLQRLGFVPTHKNGRRRAYADEVHAVHYYDELAVLRHASMPAVLFEAGVIKNREEELRLRDPVLQARMADGIATGIAACLRNGLPADEEADADRGPR